jgi:hypothetical protein
VAVAVGVSILVSGLAHYGEHPGPATAPNPREEAMQQAAYIRWARHPRAGDFEVVKGSCSAIADQVTCDIRNPYGYVFTQTGTISPDGTVDPESMF